MGSMVDLGYLLYLLSSAKLDPMFLFGHVMLSVALLVLLIENAGLRPKVGSKIMNDG